MKRYKMKKKASKKLFTKTAQNVHGRNRTNPMRGGIRL